MPGRLTEFAAEHPIEAQFLVLVAIACLALLLVTFIFAMATLWLRYRNVRKERRWERLEKAWQPRVLEVLDGQAPPEHLWTTVEPADQLYFIDYLVRFAQRLRGEERKLLSRLADPYLDVVAPKVGRGDAERRARAVQTLSILDLDRYATVVIGALDDPSPLVAMVAARALAGEERPAFAPHILGRLHRFEGWDTGFLASMLASMGPDVAPLIVDVLGDDTRPPRVRSIAADALKRLNHLPAADTAAGVLASASDVELLTATLRLIARVGRPENVAAVRGLIDHPQMPVRAAAATALGQLGSQQDLGLLLLALDDSSIWVSMHAARALRAAGAEAMLRSTALSKHPRADVAREALEEGAA